jgi:AraC-like DNA-binding protein
MNYNEILPSDWLKPYVKCFFLFESETSDEMEDVVFPSGYVEFIFNLGDGIWKTARNESFSKTPPIELWGQLTKPLLVKTKGKNRMLGIRFFAHSASYFLKEDICELNNQVIDLAHLAGESVQTLHTKLFEEKSMKKQIVLIENFLMKRISISQRKSKRIGIVSQVIEEMRVASFVKPIEKIAAHHNISSRYLQKLFLQHAGVTPKLLGKISRFQRSLKLVSENGISLTSVAYDCGYFDQSHFIREFKSFTGVTPSDYAMNRSPINALLTL